MTVKMDQLFAEVISKEMRISHFDCRLFCGKPSKLKGAARSAVLKQMGDKYLEDADMLVVMKGGQADEPEAKRKLFGILDRALGKVANNLSQSDIKTISKIDEDDDEDEKPSDKFLLLKITFN